MPAEPQSSRGLPGRRDREEGPRPFPRRSGRRPTAPAAGRHRTDRRNGYALFLVGVAALGAALVLAREVTHGPALHWDSINYLAVARNLLAGEGLLNYDGTPYTLWPPLYPLLLAAGSLGVFDPLRVAGPLNAALLGLTIFVAGRYLRRNLESGFLAAWAPLVLALSLPLTDLAWWALSEMLFVLLSTLALLGADAHLREGRRSSLALAAVSASLALLTRTLGIAVVAATAIAALFRREEPPGTRARRFLAAALVGVGPAALWHLRNLRLTDGFSGGQPPAVGGFLPDLLLDLLGGAARWLRFEWDSPALLPALLAAALVAVFAARRTGDSRAGDSRAGDSRATASRATDGRGDRSRRGRQSAALFGGCGLALAAALAAAGTFAEIDFQARYLEVAFLPFVVAVTFALDRFLASERERRRLGDFSGHRILHAPGTRAPTRLTVLLTGALTLWVAGQAAPQARAVARANSPDLALDRGYHAAPWNRIEALAALREHPEAEVVFTNLPPIHRVALYHARDGRGRIRDLPLREAAAGDGAGEAEGQEPGAAPPPPTLPRPSPEARLRAFFAAAPEGALVLWLGAWSSESFYDYGRAALRLLPGLEPVAEFADGALFRVVRAAPPDSAAQPSPWRTAYESAARAAAGAGRPDAAAGFAVRLGNTALPGFEGAALTYRRAPCDEESRRARFFLHLYPEAVGDLPAPRREPGFDNRDFRFEEYGAVFNRMGLDGVGLGGVGLGGAGLDREPPSPQCVAIVPLPGYPVRRLRTGQWTAAQGERWATEILPGNPP